MEIQRVKEATFFSMSMDESLSYLKGNVGINVVNVIHWPEIWESSCKTRFILQKKALKTTSNHCHRDPCYPLFIKHKMFKFHIFAYF